MKRKPKLILDDSLEIDIFSNVVSKSSNQMQIDGTSNLNTETGILNAKEPTELGEVITELNDDKMDPKLRMSAIDMKSNLHPIEVSSILAFDSLVSLEFLPESVSPFTRVKKRLAISQGGKGRQDIVNIVAGKREGEIAGSGQNIFQRMFKRNEI